MKPYTIRQQTQKRAKLNARRLNMSVEAYLAKSETHARCDGGRGQGQHWALKSKFRVTLSGRSRTCEDCR